MQKNCRKSQDRLKDKIVCLGTLKNITGLIILKKIRSDKESEMEDLTFFKKTSDITDRINLKTLLE